MNKNIFIEFYDSILKLWPESVDVSDKVIFSEASARIPNLIDAHDNISKLIDSDETFNHVYCSYIDWALFQRLHQLARKESCKIVYPRKLKYDEILDQCLTNDEFVKIWNS